MKFRITFKDPDGVGDSISDAVNCSLEISGLDEDEQELLRDPRREKIENELKVWIEYGEYLTVEFDTEFGTATVIPVGN